MRTHVLEKNLIIYKFMPNWKIETYACKKKIIISIIIFKEFILKIVSSILFLTLKMSNFNILLYTPNN